MTCHARVWLVAALLIVAVFAGCAESASVPAYRGEGVCFPVAMTQDPAGRYVYVVGANFDRLFRGGVVRVLDTKTDTYLPQTVEVGSFASSLMLQQQLSTDGKIKRRMLVASRDDDAVTAIDVQRVGDGPPQLGCGGEAPQGCPEQCDKAASFGGNDAGDLDIGKDPIELSLSSNPAGKGDLLHVVGTSDGKVAIVSLQEQEDGTLSTEVIDSTAHPPGIADAVTSPLTGRTYVSNSKSSTLVNYSVQASTDISNATANASGAAAKVTYDVKVHPNIMLPGAGAGEYGRGMALSSDSSRLFLAYRNPNSLVVVDVAPGLTGEPANTLLAVIGLGGSPAQVSVAPTGPDGRDLVYVSCFGSDDIWIVDPHLRAVRGVVRLPHSPYSLTVVANASGSYTLYAALFSQHTLARVPLINGLPPAGDASSWLQELKTTDCDGDASAAGVEVCN